VGTLTIPSSGSMYFDANPVIYSVEWHAVYGPLLLPVWQAVKANAALEIVSSDITLMETLIGPFKSGNAVLAQAYEQLFQQSQTRLIPITQPILREAAHLRATTRLKTIDALHAATARLASCVLFITNDLGFRNVPGLPAVILDDLLIP
jgi:predicted nucleic acid-binding protein